MGKVTRDPPPAKPGEAEPLEGELGEAFVRAARAGGLDVAEARRLLAEQRELALRRRDLEGLRWHR